MKLGHEDDNFANDECLSVFENTAYKESDPGWKLIQQIALSENQEDAFLLCNASSIRENFSRWKEAFPFVGSMFDIFCNSSPFVLKTLAELGCGFVCKNKDEMRLALEAGIKPEQVQFSSSMLVASHLKYASANRINLLAFETEADLCKIKRTTNASRLLLSIRPCFDLESEVRELSRCSQLLQLASSLELEVVGVAVGNSGGEEYNSESDETRGYSLEYFRRAITLARIALLAGRGVGHLNMDTLDMGVFASQDMETSVKIKEIIDQEFGEDVGSLKILARASEFLVSSSFALVTRVIAKREYLSTADANAGSRCFSYVINDGVFGGFGRLLFTSSNSCSFRPAALVQAASDEFFVSDLWGPSGDELDVIGGKHSLPELEVGDWIVFENMGAYTINAASTFSYSYFQAPGTWNNWTSQYWIFLRQRDSVASEPSTVEEVSQQMEANPDYGSSPYSFDDLLPEMIMSCNTQL